MKRIRVAQIGAGHDHASSVIKCLLHRSDLFDVAGVAVVPGDEKMFASAEQAYAGVRKMTVEEILNDPEMQAVFIETEDRRLTEYAIQAAERGLHIYMDKPGSESDKDFDRLIDLVKEKKLVFNMAYMYRYNPEIMKLMEEIKAGKLGEIYSVEAQMNCIHPPEKRSWLSNYPGGMLYFLGCHLIDLVYRICGTPEEVIPLSTSTGIDGVNAKDFGMAVFRYQNGVSFVKSTAVEVGGFERRQLVVCGSKGTVELKPFEWYSNASTTHIFQQTTGVREAFAQDIPDWHTPAPRYTSAPYGRYDTMIQSFAAYVNGEKQNPYDYEYERELHKLILKACGAQRRNKDEGNSCK